MKTMIRFAAVTAGGGVALGMLMRLSTSGAVGAGSEVLLLVVSLLLLVAGIHLGDGVSDDD